MAFVEIPVGIRKKQSSSASNLSVVKTGSADPKRAYKLQITVSVNAMQAMQWVIGDKVSVFFDDQCPTMVLLKPVKTGGRALGSPKGKASKGSSKERGIVKFAVPAHLPFKYGDFLECTNHEIAHVGLVLNFASIK